MDLSTPTRVATYKKKVQATVAYLRKKKRVLFLTTSNRWSGDKELAKSSALALEIATLAGNCTIIDVTKLNIFPCEGNVSTMRGNTCGLKKAVLKDKKKNPSGNHRCWASINNPTDELWKISKELFESDCVVFFGSVRWGQANGIYQKLIERLTWIENRHSTLGEKNIVGRIDAGLVFVGQNWRGKEVLATQKDVLDVFGFKVVDALCWNWQFTDNADDERNATYKKAAHTFEETFLTIGKKE